jgi:transcription termination factor Rho
VKAAHSETATAASEENSDLVEKPAAQINNGATEAIDPVVAVASAPSPVAEPKPAPIEAPAPAAPAYTPPPAISREVHESTLDALRRAAQAASQPSRFSAPPVQTDAAAPVRTQPAPYQPTQRPRQTERPQQNERPQISNEQDGQRQEPVYAEGIVEVSGKGFGFLRDAKRSFAQSPLDVFVPPEMCRRYQLRDGLWVRGEIRRGGRGPQLYKLTAINDEDPDKYQNITPFEELTTINPNERFVLETVPDRYTTRVIDLMTPIGKGQRGLLVAPPRTGKTTLLHHIADAVTKNHPETKLILLLVDERPEEVTEFKRNCPKAELWASSNDMDIKSHTRIAILAIERAKRLAEAGHDVFVLMDSITRCARAFNNAMGGGGRTMSGGVDARAMETPRRIFSAARNTEEAGSLTIVATALIETGSRMDELIFQEFKGTGNMELVLGRAIADQRVYPAVDIALSGTRREELLIPADDLHKINIIRRGLAGHRPIEAIERLLSFLKKFPTNKQVLKEIPG